MNKMTDLWLDALQAKDPKAAETIRHQRSVIVELTKQLEMAERCCRDQARTIELLHQALREAETRGDGR